MEAESDAETFGQALLNGKAERGQAARSAEDDRKPAEPGRQGVGRL